jgi:hypothetical protein
VYAVALLLLPSAALAGFEGTSTYYGLNACASDSAVNQNTCLGYYAGNKNTVGGANTFIGDAAGYANTAGASNICIGDSTGENYTTGNWNTFVGTWAGRGQADSSTGGFNTFIGGQAGQSSTTGDHNTFVGLEAGFDNTTGYNDTFIGVYAGLSNTSGQFNSAIGNYAGYNNKDGSYNSYLGAQTGESNVSGSLNVFIGNAAGFGETGSNKLYIDNCMNSAPCTPPFIYGEFDHHLLKLNGVLNVRANDVAKSQMHFSKGDTNTGGWITSVLDNNFFLSSGASFDATAGNWTQRSPDNRAVIAGSGSLGYRIFTDSGQAVAANFTPTVRLHIDYNGNLGLNQMAVAGTPIQHTSGAHLTAGGVWTDASSREYKENVKPLTAEQAMQAVAELVPVTYNYKVDGEEKHVGFIAEDVPELVATKDRRSLSPMDIVAVLTKVVDEQRRNLEEQKQALNDQAKSIRELRAAVVALQAARREE